MCKTKQVSCPSCHGRGWYTEAMRGIRSFFGEKNQYIQYHCLACKGTGLIEKRYDVEGRCTYMVACFKCYCTGWIRERHWWTLWLIPTERICTECNGNGVKEKVSLVHPSLLNKKR